MYNNVIIQLTTAVSIYLHITTIYGQDNTLFSCTFEQGMCSFHQDTADSEDIQGTKRSYDWERRSGLTPTAETGPPGGQGGSKYYAYLETSSPKRHLDKASMATPPLQYIGTVCLQFYYHMYGPDVEELQVFTSPASNNYTAVNHFLSIKGQQEDRWELVETDVYLPEVTNRVGFTGVRGKDFRGDIAMDTVTINKGSCNTGSESRRQLPFKCSFESNLCGMEKLLQSEDEFDWSRYEGSTGTQGSGPITAQDGSYYIYTDANSPWQPGNKAYISTPGFEHEGTTCISFHYHMYDRTSEQLGSLIVYTSTQGQERPLLEKSGTQSDTWIQASLQTELSYGEKVIFLGTRGSGEHNDIAVDNIEITSGQCEEEQDDYRSLPYSCDFETDDLCDMEQPVDDKFDWTRHQGATVSVNTGPGKAYSGDYYIYTEASSPRNQGDQAYIRTPKLSYIGAVCLSFYYHMESRQSDNMGSLKVYLTGQGQDNTLFEQAGSVGKEWNQVQQTISIEKGQQIVFLGTVGSGVNSDIALDKLHITAGSCDGGTSTADQVNLPYSCDFEAVSLCGMLQSSNDQFDWKRHKDDTETVNTGPKQAYKGQYYIYTEASEPRNTGDMAYIETPGINHNGEVCVSFYYHMKSLGSDNMGTLKVYTSGQGEENVIFEKSGNVGEDWNQVETTVDINSGEQIVFLGVIGSGIRSDIALDQLEITQGSCDQESTNERSLPYKCDFESADLCGMYQQITDQFDWTRHEGITNSDDTGPEQAYSGSYYIYTEASDPRLPGHKAYIDTPKLSYNGQICVSFHYHMKSLGSDNMGTLKVYTSGQGEDNVIFEKSGNVGEDWNQVQRTATITSGEKIVFLGVIGSGIRSDIALDQLDITQGSCDQGSTNERSLPYKCDFESADLCGMHQQTTDQFDWTRHEGITTSDDTGPGQAHSGSYYIYTEASDPRLPGHKAYIDTPKLSYNGQICVSFHYHMKSLGSDNMGTLKVYTSDQGEDNVIFEKSGNVGEDWNQVQRTATITSGEKIVFLGVIGSGIRSDIALDQLEISQGSCDQGSTNERSLPYKCDFESADLCGMYQQNTDQFDWTRHEGITTSDDTGPGQAHSGSYYIYTEASDPRLPGHKAYIDTPKLSYNGQICVSFHYHMKSFGSDNMGTLKVYTSGQGEDNVIFEKSGNVGEDWNQVQRTATITSGEKVIFLGIIGSGVQSDIALDNLEITSGFCENEPSTGTKRSLPFICEFEEETLCGMQQESNDNFDWLRYQGGTTSDSTGPDKAYSGTYYIYTEASNPRIAGDKAIIKTPGLDYNGEVCVRFHYHMKSLGSDNMGTLKVYTSGQGEDNVIFEKSGNVGEDWNQVERTVDISSGEQVVFLGICGSGYESDIAVDELEIIEGSCDQGTTEEPSQGSLPYTCDFEQEDLCGMIQPVNDEYDWLRHQGETLTSNTGPHGAYSGEYYIYTEASDPRVSGDKAIIQTPSISYSGSVCVEFHYHMYASSPNEMGRLIVYGSNKGESSPLFEKSESEGKKWTEVRRSMDISYGEQIIFLSIRGTSFNSDIALDKLKVTQGSCEGQTQGEDNLPFICDFEGENMCGMLQRVNDQFDWLRHKDGTSSPYTGPESAYSGIYYIYTEASDPRKPQHKAYIETPPLYPRGEVCVHFYYHMRTTDPREMGTLKVYLTSEGEQRPLFIKTGNVGNEWKKVHLDTEITSGDQVVFLGIRGSTFNGDIAVDKLMITKGTCENESETKPGEGQVLLPYSCSFESGPCGMKPSKTSDFNWAIIDGDTETSGTGPSKAMIGQAYIYAEASVPRKEGDKAILCSPDILYSGEVCVIFYYHMYDQSNKAMGSLKVQVKDRSRILFERYGNQGDEWLQAKVDTTLTYGDQVEFVATRGSNVLSDIALDDVTIYPASCDDGTATVKPPTKKPGTSLFDSYSCNMERKGETSMKCELRQNRNSPLKWHQGSGYTPSGQMLKVIDGESMVSTGPTAAHQGEYYIYLETTGSELGQRARLWLEGRDIERSGHNCLRFYYLMNGHHIGSLSTVSKKNGLQYTLWMMEGHQSMNWDKAEVEVNMDGVTQLGLVGTSGGGYSGDIALDDVTFTPGKCQSPQSGYLFFCDFESSDKSSTLCGMEQETTDTRGYDWMLWADNTPSDDTGPDKAANGQYYMYMEASKPRENGDQARILLPSLDYSGSICLEFMYHMYGYHMGTLEVYLQRSSGGSRNTLLTIEGQQGNEWINRRLDIENISRGQQIGFRGVRGTEFSGDIALDGVRVRVGSC